MQIITEQNRKWLILFAIGMMLFMSTLDLNAVNLAMAPIANQFHIPLSSAQWLVNIIAIIPAAIMVIAGRLADIYGRRKFFLTGVAIFTLASIISGFALNEYILLIGRIVQGFGMGIEAPVAVAIIFTSFPEEQRGLAIGFVVTIVGLGQVLGPMLGGFIIHISNWRFIFFVNIPLGILALVLTLLVCPADSGDEQKNKVDIKGGILLATSLILILFSINEVDHITAITFFTILLLGLILLFVFYLQQKMSANPLIETSLFKHKQFMLLTFIRFLFNFAWMTIFLFLSLYLQNVLGYGSLRAGEVMLVMMLLVAILSPFSGKLADVLTVKAPMVISLIFAVGAYILFARLPAGTSLTSFILPLFVYSISLCIIIPFSGTFALRAVPTGKLSVGSGMYYTMGFGGAALGVASIGWLLANLNSHKLTEMLAQNHISVTGNVLTYLTNVVHGTAAVNDLGQYFAPGMINKMIYIVHTSFAYGFAISMWVCAVINLIALILAFYL